MGPSDEIPATAETNQCRAPDKMHPAHSPGCTRLSVTALLKGQLMVQNLKIRLQFTTKELGDPTISKLRPQEFQKMEQSHSGNKMFV